MENNKKRRDKKRFDRDEPRIKSVHKSRKAKRHSSKENLKNVSKGTIDYDDYMEMEDWSDSR
jgi:hypothetical protein